jgi:DNA-directed RNA polymerase subunit E'/Rpb7
MDNIYFNSVLKKKINVEPKFLNSNLDNFIIQYLKKNFEGKCIAEGYVKPETITVLKKSIGLLAGSRFTGDITYEIIYTADVCNPVIGNVIDCKVKFINKLGILGHNGPITIVVRKQFNDNDNDFDNIKENDIIKVEVIAKKFHLNEKEIKIVTKIYNEFEKSETKSKKDIVQSDLTPFDDEYNDEIQDDLLEITNEDIIESDHEDFDEEYGEDDEIEDEEDTEEIKVQNPDENIIDADDIELDDSEDESEDEDIEYE